MAEYPIPEDLKEMYMKQCDPCICWQDKDWLIERIAKAEAENLQLREKVARLEATKVSDAEWFRNSFQCEAEHVGKLVAERVDLEDILADRAAASATVTTQKGE